VRRGTALVIRCNPSTAPTRRFVWDLAVELELWRRFAAGQDVRR
jgi:hypothetical protein